MVPQGPEGQRPSLLPGRSPGAGKGVGRSPSDRLVVSKYTDLALPDNPKLRDNITHFARALRRSGLPIGPGRVQTAIQAVAVAGFDRKADFYWTLHAVFRQPSRRTTGVRAGVPALLA